MFEIILLIFVAFAKPEAGAIFCEKIDHLETATDTFEKCCFLNSTTVISEANVTISDLKSNDVVGILFDYNTKIELLPVNVHEKFPNLQSYMAGNASIKEISALNFKQLVALTYLDLHGNEIEFIPNDCFESLIRLTGLFLSENKIYKMNGVAFLNMPFLIVADFVNNICTNKFFETQREPNIFRRKISRNCASEDAVKKEINCKNTIKCEQKIQDFFTQWFNRTSNCCNLNFGTFIDSMDYFFAANKNYSSLETISITQQQNMEFLPISVHKSFPILKVYVVANTPVQKIFKKNFEKMFELASLYLQNNQIQVIRSDTFEDLISLKQISIKDQRLINLNSEAFVKLHELEAFYLNNNFCIDEVFHKEKDVSINRAWDAFPGIIDKNCGFEELDFFEVECEKFLDWNLYDFCFMTKRTVINATNFVVADFRDEEVQGVTFSGNKKIEFLPYKIHLQFPNLFVYNASFCSIKQVAGENFENLHKLKMIDLAFNKIQKISKNTFKGLNTLVVLYFIGNQIKSISARSFDQIPRLTTIDLRWNKCIDERFDESQPIRNFTRKIIQNCAFTETGEREFEKLFDIECGVGLAGGGYIVGGSETKHGQWPSMAALLLQPDNQFFCGGNLITASHVLTAAHCIQNKHSDRPLEASEVVVLLGRHNISLRAEVGSETRGVKQIKVHSNWNPLYPKFESDIAVLELDRSVLFSELIQPVCLTVEPEISQHEAGYVVGWGKSEASTLHETVPRQVLISSVTTDVCFDKDYKLGSIYAQGMFCAGGDEAGPCHGDSGGGFFVRYHGLWTLRGIVSSGSLRAEGGCDVGRYSLFTNILTYTSWISDVIDNNATLNAQSTQSNPSIRHSNMERDFAAREDRPTKFPKATVSNGRVYLRRDQFY